LKIENSPTLILASASPRRAELLRAAGIDFTVMVAAVDESPREGESPEAYVRRLAEEKARAVSSRAHYRPVLGADTVVVADRQILGKPQDAADARRMLRQLSGRAHEVMTGVCLLESVPGRASQAEVHVETTSVEFLPLTEVEIDAYIASGEPMDKAGAYAIQGLASRFVTRIEDGS
jgi:septum formation protein